MKHWAHRYSRQRVDTQLGPFAIFLRTLLNEVIVHVGEHRIVDLQHHARLVDLAVFLA